MALASLKPQTPSKDGPKLITFNPKDFAKFQPGTCEFVYLHGAFRQQRKRRCSAILAPVPGCTDVNIRNPRLAFATAKEIIFWRSEYNRAIYRLRMQSFKTTEELFDWLSDFSVILHTNAVCAIRLPEDEEDKLINALNDKLTVRNADGSSSSGFIHLRINFRSEPKAA